MSEDDLEKEYDLECKKVDDHLPWKFIKEDTADVYKYEIKRWLHWLIKDAKTIP